MTAKLYESLLNWLVPALLGAVVVVGGAVCSSLWAIADKLSGINTSLAVAVYRIDVHERRLDNLETLFLRGN
jgi:hypothetical protein